MSLLMVHLSETAIHSITYLVKNIKKPKIIAIIGPTASGKSDLGIKIAQKFNGEVISADSRQVYRGMDIGTGKVSKQEQKLIRHHLIDVANPRRRFSVDDFTSRAKRAIVEISKRGKLPFVVGGTGFYVDALIYDLNIPEVPPNKSLRAKLQKQSAEQLFVSLKKQDPARAKTIERHNKVRLIRALEIIDAIGKVPSFSTNYSQLPSKYDVLWLGLNPKNLERRVATRVQKRFRRGMVAEVKKLIKNKVSLKRISEIGLTYRIVADFIQGTIDKKEMGQRVIRAEIQYAKRQMTWFKRNKKIAWVKDPGAAERLVHRFLGR